MPAIRLIIFDCDGVLVDSEPLAMRVLLRALASAGLDVSSESGFRNYLGRSFSSIAQSLDDLHGLRLDDAAIEAMATTLVTGRWRGRISSSSIHSGSVCCWPAVKVVTITSSKLSAKASMPPASSAVPMLGRMT